MPSTALKKVAVPSAYPAAASLFEQLAGLFASTSPTGPIKLETKRLNASLKALQQAPGDEVAAVNQILQEISARVFKLNENSAGGSRVSERAKLKPAITALKTSKNEDAMVRGVLARARTHLLESEPDTEQAQVRANAAVMSKLRGESAAALQRRINSKELLPPKEFQDALGITRQSVNEAVKARRMFALLGPAGEYYYPAFYADGDLNRREVEKVAKVLGRVPAASKYYFFTSKVTSLGEVTPLEALKKGRLDDVLIAAEAFDER